MDKVTPIVLLAMTIWFEEEICHSENDFWEENRPECLPDQAVWEGGTDDGACFCITEPTDECENIDSTEDLKILSAN